MEAVRVTRADLSEGADILIGIDIITRGDFSITNGQGNTAPMPLCRQTK